MSKAILKGLTKLADKIKTNDEMKKQLVAKRQEEQKIKNASRFNRFTNVVSR